MRETVKAPCGVICGNRRGGVLQFRGIPYAEPPVGRYRFASPRRKAPFAGIYDALEYGASAPQRRTLPEGLAKIAGTLSRFDEDCLNLNVWTPGIEGRRPVLVFIHGGGFVIGAGAQYPGDDLARRGDVVVVTVNYRLGLLGFNAFGEIFPGDDRFAGNAGLRDQVMALEWVRDNISAFGGDPDQVTIAGESAGAASVAFHLVHQTSWPLYQRAILQSGGLNLFYPKADAVKVAHDLLAELGAVGDPERLLGMAPDRFGAAMTALRDRHLGILSRPFIDGEMIPDLPLPDLYRAAKPVPLLVGTNRDEFSFFSELPIFPVRADHRSLTAAVAANAGFERAEIIKALYPDTRDGRIAYGTDIMFRIPALHMTETHAARAPTFAYRLDWRGKGLLSKLGATHSVDLPLLFEDFLKPFRWVYLGLLPDFPRQALSERMRAEWLAFVRTGSPGWPAYTAERRETRIFDTADRVETDPDGVRREAFDGVDGFTL